MATTSSVDLKVGGESYSDNILKIHLPRLFSQSLFSAKRENAKAKLVPVNPDFSNRKNESGINKLHRLFIRFYLFRFVFAVPAQAL